MNILIVDDDEQLGRSIARLLGREGHTCDFVDDIRAAMDRATVPPDLVVIELQLAWLGLVREYRKCLDDVAESHVPFVITTGRRELFRELGAMLGPNDDLLAKPFDAEELVARIEIALRRSGASPRADRSHAA